MALSPDGNHYWDGQAWRPALSPDGRFRWNGVAWVPVLRATVLRPTAWTVPLQRATAAMIAVQSIWGLVIVAIVLGTLSSLSALAFLPPSSRSSLTPAELENLRQTMQATILTSLIAGMVLAGALNTTLFIGCVKRWRWVFWYQMIIGLFGALGLLELPVLAAASTANPGGAGLFLLPAWSYAVSFVLDAVIVALSVWMLVALRRYGTWACVRVPVD